MNVHSKIYDKRDDFDFGIVNFAFLDGDVPRRASFGVYISQLIRFARVCSHIEDLTREINIYRPNVSSRAIGIINCEKHFLNVIADTMN